MSLITKIFSGPRTILYGKTVAKTVTNPVKTSFKYQGIQTAIGEYGTPGVAKYRVKPDITMPMNINTRNLSNPAFEIKPDLLKAKNQFQQAELGNTALRLAQRYEQALPSAEKEIKEVFDGFNVSVRAKGANSVFSKLERVLIKKKKSIKTDEEARQIIQDAIGGRIQLQDITRKDIIDTLNNIKINGHGLSNSEKHLVMNLFKGQKLSEKELAIANRLAKPIKIALAERQSEPVFRRFILGGLRDALDRNVTTIEKLEQAGISKDLIKELQTNSKIKPLRMTEINNYKGVDGVSYFSDRQISQFERLQMATGERFDIITCSENIDLVKYGLEGLSKNAQDAIKSSGYTTAQVNTVLKDGTFAEIQVRGSGPFGEYEHLKYDSVLNKNTLGEIFQPYKKAVQSLSETQMPIYDNYISKTYDYYRMKELGIQVPKPQLPAGFDPILSEESMKHLHHLNEANQARKMQTFIPHIEHDAQKSFIM